jgi:carbonic anhydrase/acetyltransferase-like protein (isoleucine patch superfamily)
MISFLKPEEQHQHRNGGGWVANTVTIDESVYVAPNAWVSGNARVSGNAWVSGNAQVFGDAQVFGNTWVETPLFIQGTRHGVSNSKHGYLSIGCITLTFAEWKKQYRAIGKKEGYTAKQIKEYGAIIALATKIGK